MSTALAIAGVSAVLRDLLNDGLIQHNAVGVLGSSVTVSVGPPDRVVPADGSEASQLNLFLYQVTPNAAWRNEGLPARDGSGRQRLANAPLALDLHYLVSAYSSADLHGEILLGYAMQLLHETPVLSRQAIRRALTPSPDVGDQLPPALRALAASGLESQLEQIRITPVSLNTEELSRLWTATQSHLRPTAAYMASVVLIEATEPARKPLPVLTVGPLVKPDPLDAATWYARGVAVQQGLVPALPTLETVEPAGGHSVARIDASVSLHGHHLDAEPGSPRSVVLANDALGVSASLDAAPAATDAAGHIAFTIPAARSMDFPAGVYTLSARLRRPGEASPRDTNRLALTLAPQIVGLPQSFARDGEGNASFDLTVRPAVHPGQRAGLVLGQLEFPARPLAAASETLHFDIPGAPPGTHLARLRVDGIESPLVDRSVTPPAFLDLRITLT